MMMILLRQNASSHLFSDDLCAKTFYLCRLEKAAMRLSLCPVSSCCDVGNIKWGRSKTTFGEKFKTLRRSSCLIRRRYQFLSEGGAGIWMWTTSPSGDWFYIFKSLILTSTSDKLILFFSNFFRPGWWGWWWRHWGAQRWSRGWCFSSDPPQTQAIPPFAHNS